MKRFLVAMLLLSGLMASVGCHAHCQGCRHGALGRGGAQASYADGEIGNPGPPSAAITYPYYTTRGPRDYFLNNPPGLGR